MAELTIINLDQADGEFIFEYFPNAVNSTDRANWNPQDTTTGVKPLFYGNREPRLVDFPELYIDSTDTGLSLSETITELQNLQVETEETGVPPTLLAVWGDRRFRCVLEELAIDEEFFNVDGHPTRIKVRLGLLQIQFDETPIPELSTGKRII